MTTSPLAKGRTDRAGCDSNEADSAEPLTLKTWCGRYHLHGTHDDCLGWGDRHVGVTCCEREP